MSRSYKETLDYLYQVLPMFQRVGAVAYKRDLGNTIRLCSALGNPHNKFKSIHVAGTNGKGSCSHMIAAILQSAGYKTGLYTSPHLKEFTERIKINGAEVTQGFVVDFVERIDSVIKEINPSFFEITVAMAFDYFASQQVDVAVIEVGLGGRLDSTNIIDPVVSLITNIGYDHKELLGNTLEAIASEKAGIIKPNRPSIISERQPGIAQVFIRKATESKSNLRFAQDVYASAWNDGYPRSFRITKSNQVIYNSLASELQGDYQKKNIVGVLAVVDELRAQGFEIPVRAVEEGIAKTVALTGLKGRWQKLGEKPAIFCDTGHNEDGIREVMINLSNHQCKKLHFVLGVVKEKDLDPIFSLLPKEASYYFCQATIPRALEVEELHAKASAAGLKGVAIKGVNDAIEMAKASAEADDLIVIGGSTFVVAEIDGL